MATLDSILSDMRDAKSLIDSRRAVDKDGSSVVTLKKQFAASLASKIGKLASLSPGDAKHLLDAARDCGQDETGVQVIVASIDAKLGVALDSDVQKPASTDHQLLTNAQSWVTESLMASLKGRSTINFKLVTLATYLANHLGCTSPHEQTYKVWLTLALLSHYAVWPRYQIVYDLLQEFKGNVRDCKTKCVFPKKASYPSVPHELPEAEFNHMFGDEAPIVIDIPRFHITAKNHVPLRKNSKLITNELKAVARLKAEPIEPTPEQVSGLKRSSSSIAAEADEPPQ